MQTKPAVFSKPNVSLSPSPINPSWIMEGNPVARNSVLSRSDDQTACTIIWDCTPGKFKWIYDFDETIQFLEGSVTIEDGHSPARKLGAGDILFFPAGSEAVWTVHERVRKIAFCRKILPGPIGTLVKVARAVKSRISPPAAEGSLMGSN